MVIADVLPGQKADKIKELQAQGKKAAWWATVSMTPRH